MNATLVAVLVLAAGTYAFRLAGPLLHGRVELPARVQELLTAGATVLLVGLLATGALTEGHGFAGWARPAGVLAAWGARVAEGALRRRRRGGRRDDGPPAARGCAVATARMRQSVPDRSGNASNSLPTGPIRQPTNG